MPEEKDNNQHNMSGGMGSRGVTRPMMHMDKDQKDDDKKMQHGDKKMDMQGMDMSMDQRKQMLHMHHMQTLWIY